MQLETNEVYACGDRELIGQVAVSLVENALTFTSGSVRVLADADDGHARLSVVDDGPGIEEATLKMLLDTPFVHGDSSSTRRAEGLGLSLYIGHQVLRASGGGLEIDSAPDRGSTFTMVLPRPVT